MLISPQWMVSRVMSSSTILFYLGTRPALLPEEMHRAPVSVIELGPTVGSGDRICSGSIAYSYSSATEGLNTMFLFLMPRARS